MIELLQFEESTAEKSATSQGTSNAEFRETQESFIPQIPPDASTDGGYKKKSKSNFMKVIKRIPKFDRKANKKQKQKVPQPPHSAPQCPRGPSDLPRPPGTSPYQPLGVGVALNTAGRNPPPPQNRPRTIADISLISSHDFVPVVGSWSIKTWRTVCSVIYPNLSF